MALCAGAVGGEAKAGGVSQATPAVRGPRVSAAGGRPVETPVAAPPLTEGRKRRLRPFEKTETGESAKLAALDVKYPPRTRKRETCVRQTKRRRHDALEAWAAQLETADGRVRLAEELLRVRSKSGKMVPLRANAVQRSFEAGRGQHENMVLKARQMGMSTWVAGQFFLRTILVPGTVTLQVAHTREAAMGLLRTVHRMWAGLDPKMRTYEWRQGRRSMTEITFPAIDSEFRIASAGEDNAGRGMTVTHMHLSEVSRWPGNAAETLAGLRAALAPGGELVLESTPRGAYGCFYNEWRTAERRGAARHFFPWWMEPGYVSGAVSEMSDEELALGLSPGQAGFRRELRERFGAMAVQEFAEDAVSCFKESGAGLFEAQAIAARLRLVPEPAERRWNGALLLWRPPMPGRNYVVAADPAGGGADGDWSTAQVVDVSTGMQCAELQVRLPQRMFALRLAELAREFGNALLVVERNNHGAGVLAFLSGERGLRMYEASDGQGGFLTTAQSRAEMLAGLGVLLANRTELFMSARLLEECRTFVMKEGGRTEAAAGSHDDLVMAMAMAQAVRRG